MNQVATSKEPTGATGTSASHKKVHLWSLSLYSYNCINIICMDVTIVVFQGGNSTFVELGVGFTFIILSTSIGNNNLQTIINVTLES